MSKPNTKQTNNTIDVAIYLSDNCGFNRGKAVNILLEYAGVFGFNCVNDLAGVILHFKDRNFINDVLLHDLEQVDNFDVTLQSKGYWELVNN